MAFIQNRVTPRRGILPTLYPNHSMTLKKLPLHVSEMTNTFIIWAACARFVSRGDPRFAEGCRSKAAGPNNVGHTQDCTDVLQFYKKCNEFITCRGDTRPARGSKLTLLSRLPFYRFAGTVDGYHPPNNLKRRRSRVATELLKFSCVAAARAACVRTWSGELRKHLVTG